MKQQYAPWLKMTARVLLVAFGFQLVFPLSALALTTGPSQPEVQSFEPVGTTDMVDMFTGDFNYNIPLLDVEGYPVNIAYHSGIGVEQEASWVGLGWNINPGEINRSVRGLPDDFNGETVEKDLKIKDEKNTRIETGISFGLEVLGFDLKYVQVNVGANLGTYINFNNYRGLGVGTYVGLTASTPYASAGMTMGVGSQTGADVDVSGSLGFHIDNTVSKDAGDGVGISVNGGTGFNSRSGLKDLSYGISIEKERRQAPGVFKSEIDIASWGSSVPIGMQNYVPVVTNQSIQTTFKVQVKGGTELIYNFPHMFLGATISKLHYNESGSRPGYGYLYSENATRQGIMDFSREKDGIYNNSLPNLPLSSMTYDVYSVSGQGTGGSFRPYRSDIGTIHDPEVKSTSNGKDFLVEFGIGNLFEIGSDFNFYDNESRSGAWKKLDFQGDIPGTRFEKAFFKQGGELTYNQQQVVTELFNNGAQYLTADGTSLRTKQGAGAGNLNNRKYNNHILYKADGAASFDRTSRANLITYLTAEEASKKDHGQYWAIPDFKNHNGSVGDERYFDPQVNDWGRYGDPNTYNVKGHQISEFAQTLPDGRRYIYGIPALNNATREVSFSVDETKANVGNGLVGYTHGTDDSKNNTLPKENYYSSTHTPAYAHSYLLTSVLSNDYVDVMGDGATDDDLGTYVKFNYTLKDKDYRWRAPYDSAQYNPGYWSDRQDGKGSYIVGSRHQWYLRSIESKNYIAEFYTSPRNDGKGVRDSVLPASSAIVGVGHFLKTTKGNESLSYKLDSIKLFNKHDRYLNEEAAIPVKTVYFTYDYSLCPGIPNWNGTLGASGKLTLKKISIKYGNSSKSLLSPYVFTYTGSSNPNYDFAAKDRWGNYKANNPSRSNYEFPYTPQDSVIANQVTAWNLTTIKLPSGGKIQVDYESDDYAYVMDKRAMQMFDVEGIGSSPVLERRNTLYDGDNRVNDYVYFKRDIAKEKLGFTLQENYLEGTDQLYYSFNLDITGTGKYEHIKAYAKVDTIGICSNNSGYGFIRLKREQVRDMRIHPATVAGLNIARYYLPHILYPGFKDEGGDAKVLKGLAAAAGELVSIWKNPFARFIRDKKGRTLRNEKSWVRLNTPGLKKRGGGIRVKKLQLIDAWDSQVAGATSASYGKEYDYTLDDIRYGKISSGVASYEPLVGGDENPFRKPVVYSADAGRWLPSIDFFQEEPFGESFFPGPVVGYSSVKVRSIHYNEGRSSQSEDEHLFYTAKEFPIGVDYTEKNAPGGVKTLTLRRKYELKEVTQGYVLRFNDMHGKLKAINNYVFNTNGTTRKKELVTGTKYTYRTNTTGQLDNTVRALARTRGTRNSYKLEDMELGKEMDFTVDSRERYNRSFNRTIAFNLNSVQWGLVPIYIPTSFFPDKEDVQTFRTMVSTKIIQQYGIVKSIESFDHGARTTTENLIYDGETGNALLTKVNNQFNDPIYNLSYPAHLAYEGMSPAYYNTGIRDNGIDSLVVESNLDGFLFPDDLSNYSPGDELMLSYSNGAGVVEEKVWVIGTASHIYQRAVYVDGSNPHWSTVTDSICGLKVLPRYKSGSNTNWPSSAAKYTNVHSKTLRSGRRNNLNQSVQSAQMVSMPTINTPQDLFTAPMFNKCLSVTANTFTDQALSYAGFDQNSKVLTTSAGTGYVRNAFNEYVMGYRGNFRPYEQYVPVAQRNYGQNHARYDGHYPITETFWDFKCGTTWGCTNTYVNCQTVGEDLGLFVMRYGLIAAGILAALNQTNALSSAYWKRVNTITKYDPQGNAIEEKDAIGNYSAVQYGYNKGLPVAVAANARQNEFLFEGFEDYIRLLPEGVRKLQYEDAQGGMPYLSHYVHSPFGFLFRDFKNLTPNNNNPLNPTLMGRGGQYFSVPYEVNGNQTSILLSKEASHTGHYSLKLGSYGCAIPIHFSNLQGNAIQRSDLTPGKKYLLHVWYKPISGTGTSYLNQFSVVTNESANVVSGRLLKASNIDGWYQAELAINMTNISTSRLVFTMPANAYIDDVRLMPIDANVKSFVYDPLTLRQMAQLDENHMATFYEYDQEGLLIRVKKETDRGVLTVSESRRANSKLP